MNETDYDTVECPVADCGHQDAIRRVAAHVSGTDDSEHSWDGLGYGGAREFVMAEKRRQQGDGQQGDGRPSGDGRQRTDGATRPGPGRVEEESSEPFELGFERDALLIASLVREYDIDTLSDLDIYRLANLYSLLADLRSSAEDARKEVRDALLGRVQDDRDINSDFGRIRRQTYSRRQVKDEETVFAVLRREGVDPEAVTGIDTSQLKTVVENADIDPNAVFDFEERPQIRLGEVDDLRRRERYEQLPADVRSFVEDER